MIEMFITICLLVFVVLTAFAVKIAHFIVDYKQLSLEFDRQQFKLTDLEEMDLK